MASRFASAGLIAVAILFGACARPVQPDRIEGLKAALPRIMQEQVDQGFYGVALVTHGKDVVFHEAYGLADRKTNVPMRRDTVIDAGSLSKQVTATAAVLLEARGQLSLDDPLSKFFEDVPADKRSITLKQLLSHTAGIFPWVLPDDFMPIPREAWLQKVFSAPLQHPPGQRFLYSNDGYTLVAMAIERVTGKPYRDYIKETFFVPLGMTHSGWYDDAIFDDPAVSIATGYWNAKDDGAPNEWPGPYWALLGNGGILWNAPDLLKWHQAIHGDLLPRHAREKLFAPAAANVAERTGYEGDQGPLHYALGWNVGQTVCGDWRIAHAGAGVSHNVDYRYYKDRDIMLYVASSRLDSDHTGEELLYARRAANAIAREIVKNCPEN